MPINLPNDTVATAYRAFADWIRRDKDIARVFNKFDSWEGDPKGDKLPMSVNQMPSLSLTPTMGAMEPFCNVGWGVRSFLVPLTIEITTCVHGTLGEESIKLWDLVFTRAMAWDYRANGVSEMTPIQPAQTTPDLASDLTPATGKILLTLYVNG